MSRSDKSASDGPSSHLDDETVRRFRSLILGPDELIEASRHLQSCADCRGRLKSKVAFAAATRSLLRRLSAEESAAGGHFDFDSTLMGYVEGSLSPDEREVADRHLADCSICRREVDDLAAFRHALDTSPNSSQISNVVRSRSFGQSQSPARWLVAAAVVAACVVGVMFLRWPQRPIAAPHPSARPHAEVPKTLVAAVHDTTGVVGIDVSGRLYGTDVSAPWSTLVAAALRNPDLSTPPELAALAFPATQLRGASPQAVVSLIDPVGVVVTTAQPVLRWRSTLTDATYRLALFDADMRPVAHAAVRTTSWRPGAPLAAGRAYVWQVSTVVKGEPVVAPGPDEPQARFSILRPDIADAIAVARRRGEGHLVLGVLLQAGGAVDDARREFRALVDANPESQIARRLLVSAQHH
jgi:hypothetical protein